MSEDCKTVYQSLFRCKWLGEEAKSPKEIAERLEETAAELRQMEADGVYMEAPMEDDYTTLYTKDPKVAEKYQFEPEEDWFGDEEEPLDDDGPPHSD